MLGRDGLECFDPTCIVEGTVVFQTASLNTEAKISFIAPRNTSFAAARAGEDVSMALSYLAADYVQTGWSPQ